MGDGRWGGPDTGEERLNTRLWTERRQKDERIEEMGMLCRAITRVNLGGGGKEGTRTIPEGNTKNLKKRDRV